MLAVLRQPLQTLCSPSQSIFKRAMSSSSADVIRAPAVKGRSFRVALIQLGNIGPDKRKNIDHAVSKIAEAAQNKVDLVVLPEIFNSPYAVDKFRPYSETIGFDASQKAAFDAEKSASETVQALSKAARDAGVWLIGGSLPEERDGNIYNTSPTFSPDGKLVALHRKVHLFDIDVPGGQRFKESDTLTGGKDITIVETDFGKIGVAICYDIRFPELAAVAARKGCVALVYPAAFNTTTGPLHWDLLQRARAVDNQVYVLMCSPARSTNGEGYQAWGHSGVTDPMGKIVSQLDEKEGILYADIDMDTINKARTAIPVTVQRRFDVYNDVAA